MVDLKLVISDPKTGKSYQKELKENVSGALKGLRMGMNFRGELIGMTGYEFIITGGSDDAGFPMRKDVTGTAKKKIFSVSGVGIKIGKKRKGRYRKGLKLRRTVAGNTVYAKTAQLNVKIIKYGNEPLDKPAEAASAEKAAPEAKKE